MQKHFNNVTAEGTTYRKGVNPHVPKDLLHVDTHGRTHFWCSVQGGTSGTSSSPRTEYRETLADDCTPHNWRYQDARYNAMIGSCSIEKVPGSGKVIFAQIHAHGARAPFVKLLLSGGHVRAEVRAWPGDDKSPVVQRFPYQLGEQVDYALNVSADGMLTIGLNGESYETQVHHAWIAHPFYFKAGAYVIDTKGGPEDGGLVVYDQLEVYHGDGRDASKAFKAAAKQYLN